MLNSLKLILCIYLYLFIYRSGDYEQVFEYINKLSINDSKNSHFYKDICLSLIITAFSIVIMYILT